MAVTIKSSQEIELMRQAGKILAKVHEGLKKELKPGMSTLDIDRIGEEMIRSFGCEPSFKNYQGYPASVCVSINEEVVHGIPRKDRIIEEGDIVSLDTGVIYKGYQSDAARTHGVGEITEDARLLIERTRQSFFEGMKYAVAIMIFGLLLFELFPSGLLGIFDASQEMLSIGCVALRIIASSFVFAGVAIICSTVFQAIGNPLHSLIMSVCRQLLVIVPVAWLLSLSGRLELVWLAFPIAEFVSVAMSIFFMKKTIRHLDGMA